MTGTKAKKARLVNPKRFPMDMARLLCAGLPLLFRTKCITPSGEPYKGRIRGGAVLAANHTSDADTFVMGTAVWYRRMFFLAAEVVMTSKFRNWLLRGVGAIRIDRQITDIEAIRRAVEVLKEGHLLGIFPQGGITEGEQIQSLKSGVILIALQAGVPIVPMYLCPPKHWYSRRVVVIGQLLDPKEHIQKKFPSTADIDHLSQLLADEMNQCAQHHKEQSYEHI